MGIEYLSLKDLLDWYGDDPNIANHWVKLDTNTKVPVAQLRPRYFSEIDKTENVRVSADFLEGSTTAGIQEAIDDITSSGVVVIPPLPYGSRWVIEETIVVDKPFWFQGMGRHRSELKLANDADCNMFNINYSEGVCSGMVNLKLDGNKANQNVDTNLINVINSHRIRLLHVYMINVKGWCVYADGHEIIADDYTTFADFTEGAIYCEYLRMGSVEGNALGLTNKIFVVTGGVVRVWGNVDIAAAAIPLFTLRGGVSGYIRNTTFCLGAENPFGIVFEDIEGVGADRVAISGNTFTQSGPGKTGIKLDDNSATINIFNNEFKSTTTPILTPVGANVEGRIVNNTPYNPIGVISTPFDNTNHLIGANGSAAGPTVASQNYNLVCTPGRIISTGGTGVAITIKDEGGNTISSPGATCDEWLEPRWKINWGAFSGAPTVMVAFK